MGVLPRNSIAWRASTRPRISGAERICTIAVDDTMNEIDARPSTIPSGTATATLGATAMAAMAIP